MMTKDPMMKTTKQTTKERKLRPKREMTTIVRLVMMPTEAKEAHCRGAAVAAVVRVIAVVRVADAAMTIVTTVVMTVAEAIVTTIGVVIVMTIAAKETVGKKAKDVARGVVIVAMIAEAVAVGVVEAAEDTETIMTTAEVGEAAEVEVETMTTGLAVAVVVIAMAMTSVGLEEMTLHHADEEIAVQVEVGVLPQCAVEGTIETTVGLHLERAVAAVGGALIPGVTTALERMSASGRRSASAPLPDRPLQVCHPEILPSQELKRTWPRQRRLCERPRTMKQCARRN
jgi:hypothetical protein